MKFGLGQPAPRKEDARFLTGQGRYVDDVAAPGALRAHVLRSPHGAARILSADATEARAAPGVQAVWLAGDVADALSDIGAEFTPTGTSGEGLVKAPHLAAGRALYAGQPVAFIVAETLAQARDAAELIEIDYAEDAALTTPEAALAGDALHAAAPGNVAYDWEIGDKAATEAAFADAAHIVRAAPVNHRIIVASMEPRAALAIPEDDGLEIWLGSQGVHSAQKKLAAALGIDPARLRVRTPDVGGGFGMKLMAHPEHALTCLAALKLGQPVKWIGTREDSMLGDAQGRDLRARAEAAFAADGTLLGLRWEALSNLGAYVSSMGAGIHTNFSHPIAGGMYRVPVMHMRVRGVYTHATPTDAYRGAGRPEVIYITERLMDLAAAELGVDPAALRRKNLLTKQELPYQTAGGLSFDSLNCAANLDRVLEMADVAGFAARRAEAQSRGRLRGLGHCYYMERTGGGVERAEIELTSDGRCLLRVGTQSSGQGHETAWAQVVHEKLGIDWDRITLLPGDSAILSKGGGTGGSKSLIMASRTLLMAGEDLVDKARDRAAEALEAAPADLEFEAAAGGRFRIAGTDRAIGLMELAAQAPLEGAGDVDSGTVTFPNGAHAAEVEIDPETGAVTIVGYWVVDDFGALVNPVLVAGQVHGGVAQGIGQALMEEARFSAEGQPQSASFMDYALPRAEDLPNFELVFNTDAPTPTNPLGVKGCGEAGAVAAVPAVTLAVHDALRHAGAQPVETPLTAEKVWRALRARGA